MAFDLKQPWSDSEVAALLSPVDDDRDWRLEADKTANPMDADYDAEPHCFFELWRQGSDYVGTKQLTP